MADVVGDPLEGRDQVLQVLKELSEEVANGTAEAEWENRTLADFLEALAVLVEEVGRPYTEFSPEVPSNPWQVVADIIGWARYYE